MASELERAFRSGIAIDASAIPASAARCARTCCCTPSPETLAELPWRPENGKVVRMFCDIKYPDGRPFEADTRALLREAAAKAEHAGYSFAFGSEMEFYIFRRDEDGEPTRIPYDHAGYMDVAPEDRGENIRREICLTLEQMGIRPESSHHEEGPSQNEIDFRYSDPLQAADQRRDLLLRRAHRDGGQRPVRGFLAQAPAGERGQRPAHKYVRPRRGGRLRRPALRHRGRAG